MRFLSISMSNFGPYTTTQTFDFTKHKGLTLIEGVNRDDDTVSSNGSGKSSIIHALCWCLYDRTASGLSKDEVVNRRVGKDCIVAVTLRADAEYVVTRWRKLKSKHGVSLTKDGVDISGKDMFETQEKIAAVLGMSADTFCNTIVFGQTAAYRFSLLTDAQQKEILDDALGIGVYAKACDIARAQVRDLASEMSGLEREIEVKQKELDRLVLRLEADIEAMRGFSLRQADTKKKLKERLARTQAEHERLLATASKRHTIHTEYKAARQRLETVEDSTVDVRKETIALKLRIDTTEEQIAALEHDYSASCNTGEGECLSCGQEIDHDCLTHHLERISADIDRSKKLLRTLKRRHNTRLVDLTNRLTETTNLKNKVKNLADRLLRATNAETDVEEVAQRITDIGAELRELATDACYLEKPIAENTEIVKELRLEIGKIKMRKQVVEHKQAHYSFWADALSTKGLRSLILDNALPILNEKVQQFSRILTNGNITIEFKTQTTQKSGKVVDKFGVVVDNRWGADSYRAISEGEKAKVDLCVGLALQALVVSRNRQKLNVAFFDEPFERMDNVAMDRVAEFLSSELGDRDGVYVITHKEALKAHFPNVVRVVKQDGQSSIS